MLTQNALKRKLDYVRLAHLTIMFMAAMLIYLFSNIPHKWWVLLTVIVISAGIEPGLIVKRAAFRIGGTFAALLILIPLLYLSQFNYRLIPVIFIVAVIGFSVSTINTNRYDISVFFMTLIVFFLLAQTTEINSPQGPFVMMLNRGICTLLGVAIVLIGDYFLFQTYNYSQKLYLFHQMVVYNFFKDEVEQIIKARPLKVNRTIFIAKLRTKVINTCAPIVVSAQNLKLETRASKQTIKRVDTFQETIWEIRRVIFALSVSEFFLNSPSTTQKHLQRFNTLMNKAKNNFVYS